MSRAKAALPPTEPCTKPCCLPFDPQQKMLQVQIHFRGLSELFRNNQNWDEDDARRHLRGLARAALDFESGLEQRQDDLKKKNVPYQVQKRQLDQMITGAFLPAAS
jgi:hypothetical protein